jgi:hypothetical protein
MTKRFTDALVSELCILLFISVAFVSGVFLFLARYIPFLSYHVFVTGYFFCAPLAGFIISFLASVKAVLRDKSD